MARLRPLMIDEEAREKVAQVIRFAENHPYQPADQDEPPGDNPYSVCYLNTYRCVFSFTKMDSATFRDLSIGIPGDKWPHPIAAFTIAELFGFTGWDGQTMTPPDDLDDLQGQHLLSNPDRAGNKTMNEEELRQRIMELEGCLVYVRNFLPDALRQHAEQVLWKQNN